MEEKQETSYYSIIPATILYNENLKANQKLLYAIITSLTHKEGYCYATNRYLAEKLGVKTNTVSSWITDLNRKGFIKVELIRNDKKQIVGRRIYLNDTPYTFYNVYPSNIKIVEGISHKSKENNITNNNKIIYKSNYEQREYTEEFLESLYAN